MASLHEKIILPLGDMLRGEQVHRQLKLLCEAEQWSEQQTMDFQKEKLQELLVYAAREVPFYRDWFHSNGIDPSTIKLQRLPIVNKGIMRQEGIARFSSEHFPANERLVSRSSGSTGEPFTHYTTKLSESVNTASKLRTWCKAGYRMGMPYMKIANGKRHGHLKKLQDWVNRCRYVPFYSMDNSVLESILERIEKEHPLFVRSYPVPLYLLAQYRNSHPTSYHYCPKHIFTTGSTLPTAYRTEIEKAFGCDVIDSYSCEGTPNTYETTDHDGYHVCRYYGIIEVLDDNNQPVTNGIGRVVSTDLWNLAHPFIRYDTQDLVEVCDGQIQRIMGRECESLVNVGGHRYTVHNFSHFFIYEVPGIDAYQLVKHSDKSITFQLVVNNTYTPAIEQYIIDHWHNLLQVPVNVAIVDEIPLMHNNKRLTIVEE